MIYGSLHSRIIPPVRFNHSVYKSKLFLKEVVLVSSVDREAVLTVYTYLE